jgi:hypothetical protein
VTRERRLLALVLGVGFAVGGIAIELLVHGRGIRLVAVVDLVAGWALATAGAAAWVVSPRSRVGPLLLASAAGWFIGTLAVPSTAFGRSDLGWIAAFLVQGHAGFLVQATMTWPSGRVTRPTQRVTVAGGYIVALFPQVWYQEPGYLVLGALLASGVIIDHRSLTPARRAAYRPARDAGLVLAAGLACIPAIARAMDDLHWAVLANGATLWAITVALVGSMLAIALLRGQQRGGAADLAVELQETGAAGLAGELERLVRDAAAVETPDDAGLRAAVAQAASLAERNRDLREALASRVDELEASRRRLIEIGDDELRALVERLRSGAGAHLDALEAAIVSSAVLGSREPFRSAVVGARLARVVEQVARARLELNALATGLDPGRVNERGLGVALGDLVSTSPVPVGLLIAAPQAPSASVATTLYFVASEALANVARHAHARSAWLQLREVVDGWQLVVEDDGIGGADVAGGTGLRGLQERLEALGGALEIHPRLGGGTRLSATVPAAQGTR